MDYINNLEQWMPVREFPNYMVSSHGRVMNIRTFRVLKPGMDGSTDYLFVNLCKDGEVSNKRIHRLVAEAFILNLTNLPCVDHKNRNSLNNHLSNLRWCTKKENSQNMSKRKNTASMYKGVCFDKSKNKWVARIKHNGHQIHLGYFTDEFEAAHVYDRKASELFGVFAKLNF